MFGEVPIGSIIWFAGTRENFINLTKSGSWVACDGSQIVLDPIVDSEIFEALGGKKLSAYYEGIDEGRPISELSSLTSYVSPMLKKCNDLEVITGIKDYNIYQKTLFNSEVAITNTGVMVGGSFKDLDAASLTGHQDRWFLSGTYDTGKNYVVPNEVSSNWARYWFNVYNGLTYTAGLSTEWANGITGAFVNFIPSGMYKKPTPDSPYSIGSTHGDSNDKSGGTYIEFQNIMESDAAKNGSFQRQGPYYLIDAYATINIEEYIPEIQASQAFIIISSSYTSDDSSNYFGADGKYILYEESEQCVSFRQSTHTKPGANQDSYYINAYPDSNQIQLFNGRTNNAVGTWFRCYWKTASNIRNHTGSGIDGDDTGNYNLSFYPPVDYQPSSDFHTERMYLYDFNKYCQQNPTISGNLLSTYYNRFFTTTRILVPIGEKLEVQTYFEDLLDKYKLGSQTQNTLSDRSIDRSNVSGMITFMHDNAAPVNYGQKYVFTTPDLEDGETIVAAKGDSWSGKKISGSIPNISGYFEITSYAVRIGSNHSVGGPTGPFTVTKDNIGNKGSDGTDADFYRISFDAKKCSTVYKNNNPDKVLPAGFTARPMIKIR